jgi:hypothetical protein
MPRLVQEQSFVRGPDNGAHAGLVILAAQRLGQPEMGIGVIRTIGYDLSEDALGLLVFARIEQDGCICARDAGGLANFRGQILEKSSVPLPPWLFPGMSIRQLLEFRGLNRGLHMPAQDVHDRAELSGALRVARDHDPLGHTRIIAQHAYGALERTLGQIVKSASPSHRREQDGHARVEAVVGAKGFKFAGLNRV